MSTVPTAVPLLAEDLGAAAIPHAAPGSSLRSLSKPAFSPDKSGLLLTGTEEQEPAFANTNQLVFAKVDFKESQLQLRSDGSPAIWTQGINGHVRDTRWIDGSNAVVAIDAALAVINVDNSETDNLNCEVVHFPEFHKDSIREIAVHPDNNLVLSGGFDGCVFVTDLYKLASSLDGKTESIQNTMYPGDGDVVGSVSWMPGRAHTASATTDVGKIHLFDIRTHLNTPAMVYDTGKASLFGHAFTSEHIVVLGYGDGELQVHDLRKLGPMMKVKDPYQTAIGDVRAQVRQNVRGTTHSRSVVVTCGHPGVSVWVPDEELGSTTSKGTESVRISSHHRAAGLDFAGKPQYKISGDFVPGTDLFAATDSLGSILVLDTSVLAEGGGGTGGGAGGGGAGAGGAGAGGGGGGAGAGASKRTSRMPRRSKKVKT